MVRNDDSSYELVKDSGTSAPTERGKILIDPNMAGKIECKSKRLWIAIKSMKSWDCSSLEANAQVPYSTASRCSRCLTAFEYARCDKKDRRIKDSHDQYQLIRETGPEPPLFLDDGTVFDANLFLQELWALKKSNKSRRARA
jgi:hypothetical protein